MRPHEACQSSCGTRTSVTTGRNDEDKAMGESHGESELHLLVSSTVERHLRTWGGAKLNHVQGNSSGTFGREV